MGVVVGIGRPAAGALLGVTSSGDGSDAAIDNDTLLVEILAKELAFSEGVLVYPFPFVRLLVLGARLAVRLPAD